MPPTKKHAEISSQKPISTTVENTNGSQYTVTIRNMEKILYGRINDIRDTHRLKNLKENQLLSRIARNYSRRMGQENFFSHFDPSGHGIADRVGSEGLSFSFLGENIAKNCNVRDPVAVALESWMNSKEHRNNILSGKYSETGIGIWKMGNQFFFTQIFMKP